MSSSNTCFLFTPLSWYYNFTPRSYIMRPFNKILFLLLIVYLVISVYGDSQPRIVMHLSTVPSSEHISALTACGNIIAENWKSPVQTRIQVVFRSDMNRTLASAFPTSFYNVNGTDYPVAMAKHISRRDLNVNSTGRQYYDMSIQFNEKQNFYLGVDGKPRSGEYDFVTTCVHEIVHGLFMVSNNIFTAQLGNGSTVGDFVSQTPHRYEQFLACETEEGDCALESYQILEKSFTPITEVDDESPRKFGSCITGNTLWFRAENERIARLYAPNTFTRGSSISHLDERSYQTRDSLLTPFLGTGYAKHTLDPLLQRIMHVMLNSSERGAPLCSNKPEPRVHAAVMTPVPLTPTSTPTPTPTRTPTPSPSPTPSSNPDIVITVEFLP